MLLSPHSGLAEVQPVLQGSLAGDGGLGSHSTTSPALPSMTLGHLLFSLWASVFSTKQRGQVSPALQGDEEIRVDSGSGEAGALSFLWGKGEQDSFEQGHQSPSFPAEVANVEAFSHSFVPGEVERASRREGVCVHACTCLQECWGLHLQRPEGLHIPVRLSVGGEQL